MAKAEKGAKAPASASIDAMPKEKPPVAPFKAHKGGVRASGTVSAVKKHHMGGGHVQVTIRHSPEKKPGEFEPYDGGHETSVTMPGHLAKRFPFGKKVAVHVMPHGAMSAGGGALGIDNDDEEGESAASQDNQEADESETPIAKAYKKAGKKSAKA